MRWHLPRRLAALAAILVIALWSTPCAAADPPGAGGGVVDSPTLSMSDLGQGGTISFEVHRDVTSTSVSFPVPQGLAPMALNATLEIPVNLRFGNLTVTQDGRTISRQTLPDKDQSPMVIPLAGTQVFGDYANVTLTVTAVPLENYCWDPLTPIRLVNSSIAFTGREVAPTTVAAFLPPVLRRLTIGLPAKPSLPESDAAVQLVTALKNRYGGQRPDIVLVPLPDGATALAGPSAPLERQIILKEGPDKGLSLQGAGVPALLISGPGNELTNQTRLLTDDSLQYALAPKAVADSLMTDQKLLGDSTTLEEMNKGGLSSEALWPQVGIDIDQSRFGHPLHGIRVHLVGSYTALPNNFGGQVTASVNGEVLDHWAVDPNGAIDRSVSIPDRLIKRSTTLEVSVRTTGDPGHCGDYLPIILRIDSSTQVQVDYAKPPVPLGFQSLPQALMPRIQIGIGADAFADTVRAATIMAGLQGASGVPLVTTVVPLKEAIASHDPAVLISSDGWTDKTLGLPFSADQGLITVKGVDTKGKSVTLTLDPAVRYGSLQTLFDGQRTILVATSNGSPAQLDELLRWLSDQGGRLSGLNGRAVISVPGSEPVAVPVPTADVQQAEGLNVQHGGGIGWWIAGGVGAVATLIALTILWRARRTTQAVRNSSSPPD